METWYQRNKQLTISRTLAWRKNNPEGRRKHRRTARGVKSATGETKIGPCELCRKRKNLKQDHDHETGEARGWLCNRCNIMLGWWEIIQKEIMTEKIWYYLR